ncbi:hypothetical protein B4096_1451 [Heyndrickxia coagulans]|nr:hypothetical protein B4096_1451 [Heyndrickxia coagulans]
MKNQFRQQIESGFFGLNKKAAVAAFMQVSPLFSIFLHPKESP